MTILSGSLQVSSFFRGSIVCQKVIKFVSNKVNMHIVKIQFICERFSIFHLILRFCCVKVINGHCLVELVGCCDFLCNMSCCLVLRRFKVCSFTVTRPAS